MRHIVESETEPNKHEERKSKVKMDLKEKVLPELTGY
jgi:hypothetical protein